METKRCFLDGARYCTNACIAYEQVMQDMGECVILSSVDKLVRNVSSIARVMLVQDADRIRNSGPKPPVVR